MANNMTNTVVKVLKVVGTCITTAAVAEIGYLGGRMLQADIECTVNTINAKVNPIEMRKRHWWCKPEAFNVRKNQFVADLKKSETK